MPQWQQRDMALDLPRMYPHHTFIFLTKESQNLALWNPWPDNAWVGVTATNRHQTNAAIIALGAVQARVRFLSFEPLLEHCNVFPDLLAGVIQWFIIGARTQPLILPQRIWVENIEAQAAEAHIPVFEKSSLSALFPERALRKEWPSNEVSGYAFEGHQMEGSLLDTDRQWAPGADHDCFGGCLAGGAGPILVRRGDR